MKATWRSAARVVALAALALLTVAGGAAPGSAADVEAARKEGKVVLYGDQSTETIRRVADAFKARHPGIAVDFFRGDSTAIMQRFEQESASGRHEADVIMTTVNRSVDLWQKGLLQGYSSPHKAQYPAELQPQESTWHNFGITTTSFAYNTDLVKGADVPRSHDDLLDPRWKGRIGIQDPRTGGGGAHTWIMMMYVVWGEEKWTDYFRRLGGQIGRYGAYFPVREALAAGEVAIQAAG